jgi:hypothetical protein
MAINKAVAGQSIWSSVHIYDNGTVRCVGSNSDDREEYKDWTKAEKAILHKAVALIAGKVGKFESEDQAKIVTALDDKITELKAVKLDTPIEG